MKKLKLKYYSLQELNSPVVEELLDQLTRASEEKKLLFIKYFQKSAPNMDAIYQKFKKRKFTKEN